MSFDLKISVSKINIDQKMSQLERELFQYAIPHDLDQLMQLGKQEGQRLCPVKTGLLRGSGVITRNSPLSRTLEFTAPYAMATNVKHPTKAGWFDCTTEFIKKGLPEQVQKTVREQTGQVNR